MADETQEPKTPETDPENPGTSVPAEAPDAVKPEDIQEIRDNGRKVRQPAKIHVTHGANDSTQVSTEHFVLYSETVRGTDFIQVTKPGWVGEPILSIHPDQLGELLDALNEF